MPIDQCCTQRHSVLIKGEMVVGEVITISVYHLVGIHQFTVVTLLWKFH
jgi:hypothetical protein